MAFDVEDGWGETPLEKFDRSREASKLERKRSILLAPFDIKVDEDCKIAQPHYLTFIGSQELQKLVTEVEITQSQIQKLQQTHFDRAFRFLIGIKRTDYQMAGIILKKELVKNRENYSQDDCHKTFKVFIDRLNTEGQTSFPNICREYWQRPQSSKLTRSSETLQTGFAFCPLTGRKVHSLKGVVRNKVQEVILPTLDSKSFNTLRGKVIHNSNFIEIALLQTAYKSEIIKLFETKKVLSKKLTLLKGSEIKDSLRSDLLNKLDNI